MIDFRREKKTYVDNDTIKILNENEFFEISLEENGCLYIGFCIPNEDKLPREKTFKITDENKYLYLLIENLYDSFKNVSEHERLIKESHSNSMLRTIIRDNPYSDGKIIWYSDDFKIQEASILTIEKSEDSSFLFTFTRSSSSEHINTYFVCISNIFSRYTIFNTPFINFYRNLLIYEKINSLDKKNYQRTNKL